MRGRYGPKIEYTLRDAIGRHWQCGTIQVDFSMPERLGAEYVAPDNSRKTPVMLHRAVVGSLERFIGILIEQHAGAMPAWLAPSLQKLPYVVVVGDKEMASGQVAVRARGNQNLGAMPLETFAQRLAADVAAKS